MNLPFKQKQIKENVFIREFSDYVKTEDLVWHRDKYDRTVEVVSGKGWSIQLDNQVPQMLTEGSIFKIESKKYHRLLKGEGDLIVRITEHKNAI